MSTFWRAVRRALMVVLLVISAAPSAIAQRGHHGGPVQVHGYYRKNGTYVAPHTRAAPGTASPTYNISRAPKQPKVATETRLTTTKAPPSGAVVRRDANGRIERSESAKRQFMQQTGFPHGRPGYVIDHVVPLACGGADAPSNMQWQTVAEGKAKDKTERIGCGSRGRR